MDKITDRLTQKILNKFPERKSGSGIGLISMEHEKELSLLNPGKPVKKLVTDYYKKKISGIVYGLAGISIILLTAVINNSVSGSIGSDNTLTRHDVGKGDYSVSLSASTKDYEYGELTVGVDERKLKDEECKELMDELYGKLPLLILAENGSVEHIESDLYLPSAVEGYPFALRWESSDYLTVETTGKVNNADADERGEYVDLKVYMTYRETENVYDIELTVYPVTLSADEQKKQRLFDALDAQDAASGTDISYSLPEEIDGMKITWKESKQPVYPLILAAGLCVLLGIWYGTDRDLKKRYEERNRRMIMDYADFVSKLQILLSSGSTIRKSLERMADDYKNSREKGGRRKYVYEELLLCTRKLGDGMSEAACLEFFGNRCGLSCYKKLTALLIQNLRKGTDSLIEAMDNEVRTAFEERKAAARKAGEEAQTRLILPMMLMLSVVMIIIMVPAYLSFGGM